MTSKLSTTPNELLFKASRLGTISSINRAIASGALVSAQGENEWTALHYAAMAGRLKAVNHLLSLGADPNAFDDWDLRPLHLCTKHFAVCQALVAAGADPTAWSCVTGETPLHTSAFEGTLESAEFFVKAGCDINHDDMDGMSPLHRAIAKRRVPMAKLLVSLGADPESRNYYNLTCIDAAKDKMGKAFSQYLKSNIGLADAIKLRNEIEQASPFPQKIKQSNSL